MKRTFSVGPSVLAAIMLSTAAIAQEPDPARQLQTITQPLPTTTITQPVPATTTITAPAATAAMINTATPQEFLSSLAAKFGTSVSRLQSLMAKLPPRGKGLNIIEISVISNKLGLSKEERQIFKSRVGPGGTGFTSADIAGMGVKLGLTDVEVTRLSQGLGLANPTIATPAVVPPRTTAEVGAGSL